MSELQLILAKLEHIESRLDGCATKDDLRNFATKDDLRNFATKDDLRNFATKDDLRNFATKDDLKNFATKDDLKNFATKDDLKNFATKDDLKNFATKEDLKAFATKEDLKAFATKEEIETLEFVLREEYTTIYNIALENKKNIEELLKYRDLFYARSEEVSKIPMLEARLEVVEDAVREHTEEIQYLKQA